MTKSFSYTQAMIDAEHVCCAIEAQEEAVRFADAKAQLAHEHAIAAYRNAVELRRHLRQLQRDERRLHRRIALEDAKMTVKAIARKLGNARLQSPVRF